MEYTMTRHLSAARMRKIPETEFKKFITYGTESYDNVQVKIQTMDNLIFKDKENERIYKYQDSLPCFFCSEYDLIKQVRVLRRLTEICCFTDWIL